IGHAQPAASAVTGNAQPAGQWLTVSTSGELDSALAQARAAGQPLLLDWYADWCISCKVIEHEVLNNPRVLELLKGYRLVRFDITASNAEQRAL
ncbi:thioredoxin family protein, partial [Salmonella enterica subsp. enterica]